MIQTVKVNRCTCFVCFPHRFRVEIKASLSDSLLIVERLFSVSIFTRSEQRHEITFCLSHFRSKSGEKKRKEKKRGGGGSANLLLAKGYFTEVHFLFRDQKKKRKEDAK